MSHVEGLPFLHLASFPDQGQLLCVFLGPCFLALQTWRSHLICWGFLSIPALNAVFYVLFAEKAMAPHSRTLAWRIPGTGEPGGLPSMGSHRVRHDWSDLAAACIIWLCRVFTAAQTFSRVVENGGYSLVAVRRLLTVVASLVAEHRL